MFIAYGLASVVPRTTQNIGFPIPSESHKLIWQYLIAFSGEVLKIFHVSNGLHCLLSGASITQARRMLTSNLGSCKDKRG